MSTKLGKLLGTLFLSVGLMTAVSIGGCSSSTSTPPTDAGHDGAAGATAGHDGSAGSDATGAAGSDATGAAGSDAATTTPDAADASDASDASDAGG